MRAVRQKVLSADDAIPFPEQNEFFTQLRETDYYLRSLRKKVESGEEIASIARTTALLYVDLIARIQAFSRQLDEMLEGQLSAADRPFRENVRRVRSVLSIYSRLTKMMLEATNGLFECLGGKDLLTLQLMDRWIKEHPETTTLVSALERQLQRVERKLATK